MIELKNISKQFQQKHNVIKALDNVSLQVPQGKVFGVIGASGAGKSTLIRCVNLLERPDSGEIRVNGINLMKLSSTQLAKERRQIGMIFQHFNLLSSRTVFDNIAFPLELDKKPAEEIKNRVHDLLKLVGLEEKQHEYPANLSGGQKQRVAIARTLASKPRVLLCDEATSALDPATTKSILELLKNINQQLGITILLITHEMDVVKSICDEVAVISDGKLIEQGSVSDIFAHPKSELAKQFISSTLKINIPKEFQEMLDDPSHKGTKPLLKLEFTGDSVNDPVMSEVSREFQLDNNIIFAQIEYAGNVKFGAIVVEITGATENIEKAIDYYKSKHINVEVLGYV